LSTRKPEVGPEEEVDADGRDPYIYQSEVKVAIKLMKEKKVSEYEVVPRNVLRLLEEDGLQQMTQLINTIYETGKCPKHFIKLHCLP